MSKSSPGFRSEEQRRTALDFIPRTCANRPDFDLEILDQVITLAVEIAREGREGKKLGTIFTVFNADKVMANSRCLILDPLAYHPAEKKNIHDANLRETLKELAQLDGAFIIDNRGTAISACRYLNASGEGINLPLGLGSRHMAAASISKKTETIAVVVSESSVVRIFIRGEIVSEIIPEIWLLKRYSVHLEGDYSTRNYEQMTILDKDAESSDHIEKTGKS